VTENPTDPTEEILADLAGVDTGDAPSADAEEVSPEPAVSRALEALLARTPLPADSQAAVAVDKLLRRGSERRVSVERRKKLMAALDAALAERRRDTGPIQSVLRSRRYSDGTPLSDVAVRIRAELRRVGATLDVDVDTLREIENGGGEILDTSVMRILAAWSVISGLPKAAARRSYSDAVAGLADDAPLRAAAGADIHEDPGGASPAVVAFTAFLDSLFTHETKEN
jgi:hypothetical protein